MLLRLGRESGAIVGGESEPPAWPPKRHHRTWIGEVAPLVLAVDRRDLATQRSGPNPAETGGEERSFGGLSEVGVPLYAAFIFKV